MWSIDFGRIIPWLDLRDNETVACIFASLELLQEQGPNLGRPLVDSIKGSKFKNLKELRPVSPGDSEIRILFIFDLQRKAILLYAGDKSKGKAKWSNWYKKAIPEAEREYQKYLEDERRWQN